MSVLFPLITGIVLGALAALSALFSAIETALFVLQPFQIQRLKERNQRLGVSLEKIMEHPRRLLSAVLLGDAMVNLPLIIICLFVLDRIAPTSLHFWGEALIIFALVVLVCDLTPKLAGLAAPYRVARIGGITFSRLMPVLDPVCIALQQWSDAIANSLIGNPRSPHVLNEGELEMLVEMSAEEGALHPTECELIQEIIKLGGKTVKDCMTPRIDAFTIPDDLTNEEAMAQLKANRHQRVPVYADTPDNILGVLEVKAFLLNPGEHYTELMVPPSFVPETMRALDLFRSFLNHPQGMAIIVDEFGGTEGIITLSDMIEEIISDAVPSADHALYIEKVGDGKLIVNGSARLDDLAEIIGKRFEEEGIDTIGGLIFNRLGYLPKPGAYFQLDDLSVTVRRTSRKRVEEMLIVQHDHEGGGGEMIFVLLAVGFCLLVSGLFSGIEAGILSINHARLRYQAKMREKNAVKLLRLLSHPERLLATVLLVTNFMNICAVAVSTRALAHRFGVYGYIVALVVWLPVYLALEMLPKSIFRRFPYRALVPFAELLRLVYWSLSPVLSLGSAIYYLLSSKREPGVKLLAAREDFKYIIAENEKSGALSRIEGRMIYNVVDFHNVTARQVMSPMTGIPSVKSNASVEELIAISRDSHIDRLPVVTPDGEIAGLVNLFDVLLDRGTGAEKVSAYTRRIVTVPPDEPAYSIIRKLRAARGNLAVVVDGNFAPAGIISSETLIKRLFGVGG